MDKAVELSIDNVKNGNGGPFGCVIISQDKEILSFGINEVTKNNDPTSHAEINAIRAACEKLKSPFLTNCSIYTSCEPCPMCYGAIKWAKLKNIYYCNTREQAKQIGFDDQATYDEIIQKKQKMTYMPHTNGLKSFQEWEKSQNKILY